MASTALRPAASARTRRLRPSTRLGWVGLTLGLISLNLEALAFLGALFPLLGWYTQAQLQYGPALVTFVAMLALGGPPALAGVICAGARHTPGWRGAPAVAGVALCALALAIPISYAAFVVMYLSGLI
jgi:hypothetical protein